jgi:hypothetical protein
MIEFTVSELIKPSSTEIDDAVSEDVIKLLERLVEKLEKKGPNVCVDK